MKNPPPRISVCMHVMNRLGQLQQTLAHNLATCTATHSELVLVDFGSDPELADWVCAEFADELVAGRLLFFRTATPRRFHASKSKNLAHRLASGDVLLNCDADNFVDPLDIALLQQAFAADPELVVQQFSGEHGDGTFGRIALGRRQFQVLGGYDEALLPMSCQDDDLLARARLFGLRHRNLRHERLRAVINERISAPPAYGLKRPQMSPLNLATAQGRMRAMGWRRDEPFATFRVRRMPSGDEFICHGEYNLLPDLGWSADVFALPAESYGFPSLWRRLSKAATEEQETSLAAALQGWSGRPAVAGDVAACQWLARRRQEKPGETLCDASESFATIWLAQRSRPGTLSWSFSSLQAGRDFAALSSQLGLAPPAPFEEEAQIDVIHLGRNDAGLPGRLAVLIPRLGARKPCRWWLRNDSRERLRQVLGLLTGTGFTRWSVQPVAAEILELRPC